MDRFESFVVSRVLSYVSPFDLLDAACVDHRLYQLINGRIPPTRLRPESFEVKSTPQPSGVDNGAAGGTVGTSTSSSSPSQTAITTMSTISQMLWRAHCGGAIVTIVKFWHAQRTAHPRRSTGFRGSSSSSDSTEVTCDNLYELCREWVMDPPKGVERPDPIALELLLPTLPLAITSTTTTTIEETKFVEPSAIAKALAAATPTSSTISWPIVWRTLCRCGWKGYGFTASLPNRSLRSTPTSSTTTPTPTPTPTSPSTAAPSTVPVTPTTNVANVDRMKYNQAQQQVIQRRITVLTLDLVSQLVNNACRTALDTLMAPNNGTPVLAPTATTTVTSSSSSSSSSSSDILSSSDPVTVATSVINNGGLSIDRIDAIVRNGTSSINEVVLSIGQLKILSYQAVYNSATSAGNRGPKAKEHTNPQGYLYGMIEFFMKRHITTVKAIAINYPTKLASNTSPEVVMACRALFRASLDAMQSFICFMFRYLVIIHSNILCSNMTTDLRFSNGSIGYLFLHIK
jgi:hypothetical protein